MRKIFSFLLLSLIASVAISKDGPPPKIAPVLQPFVDSNTLAGAVVLVADANKVLDLETVGWMDVAAKKPMRPDSLFWIASQSKPMTCTALMILVDDGKVNVDDPVEKYVPEFKGVMVSTEKDEAHQLLKKPSRQILVRDVMSHISGLPGITPMMKPTLDSLPLQKTVLANTMIPLEADPGKKYIYSNPGINTVGRIIEVASGMPFEKFMEERLFKPLGMVDTTFWPNDEQLSRLAKSYKPTADKKGLEETTITSLRYPLNDRSRNAFPGGGLFSTATDLSRFYRMVANSGKFEGKQIVSEKSYTQMTTDQTGDLKANYGFGFSTGGKTIGHGGAYSTNSKFDPATQLITIFLVQHAGWADEGKNIQPAFQKAALEAFGSKPATTAPGQTAATPTAPVPTAPIQKAPSAAPPAVPNKVDGMFVVDRARVFPAPDREKALVGGKISGSNVSPNSGFKVLAEIKDEPKRGEWNEISFKNSSPYRWIRYEAPAGSNGNVAELEIYSGTQQMRGPSFGPSGTSKPGGTWKNAFDGKTETWVNSNSPDDQYVGLDLGDLAATSRVTISPNGGDLEKPQLVTLKSATPGAVIRYTLDGTVPNLNNGKVYSEPFMIEKNSTIVTVASKEGLAPSVASTAVIWVGKPARGPMNSFHVGNSLTGDASRYAKFIRTAGGVDAFPAYLIGGSTTFRLWTDSQGKDKDRWAATYAKAVHPLDYFTMQPRDFNIAQEAECCVNFIKLLREKSPDMQPWLYAEWVERDRTRPSDKGTVPSSQMKKTFPALTWEESMAAMLLYNEEVRDQIKANYKEGKPVRVIPTATAFGLARNLIDTGKFPGVSPGEASFYDVFFADSVHVNQAGSYLVGLTWYSALYRESPEGKFLPIDTNLTSEQAGILQRLAWDVVKNYPDCGMYEEGSAACGQPEFMIGTGKDEKVRPVTLTSSTAGASFRYTLDGTIPTRTCGYVYNGVISLRPEMTLKAVAFKSGMGDSAVAEKSFPTP